MRRLLAGAGGAVTLAAALTGTPPSPATAAGAPRAIAYQQWSGSAGFGAGTPDGTRVSHGRLRIDTPLGTYLSRNAGQARVYEFGRWTSAWVAPGFDLTELVPSWDARTPRGTWVRLQVRGTAADGSRSSWDTVADWAAGDGTLHRTSHAAQADDSAHVATDTWVSDDSAGFRAWQLRLTLYREAGTDTTPRVRTVGAMVSRLPRTSARTSLPGVARGVLLPVPRYSQMVHTGEYPRYGGGGEAWCSPTSTSMVLGYYRSLPDPAAYSWVDGSYADRFVDHAARMTYDYRYDGTGNWPFNTAYAATHTGHAFVTRLRSLREAERFVAAGIPVVTSLAFGYDQLDGSPIHASNGHLVVVVGFRDNGDVVVNDPAARQDRWVRRTYDRGQFEDAWLTGSGGLSYIIRDDAHPLPARNGNTNW